MNGVNWMKLDKQWLWLFVPLVVGLVFSAISWFKGTPMGETVADCCTTDGAVSVPASDQAPVDLIVPAP